MNFQNSGSFVEETVAAFEVVRQLDHWSSETSNGALTILIVIIVVPLLLGSACICCIVYGILFYLR